MDGLTSKDENINVSNCISSSKHSNNLEQDTLLNGKEEINFEEEQYLLAVRKVIDEGFEVMDRTGIGIRSIFGMQMRYNLRNSAHEDYSSFLCLHNIFLPDLELIYCMPLLSSRSRSFPAAYHKERVLPRRVRGAPVVCTRLDGHARAIRARREDLGRQRQPQRARRARRRVRAPRRGRPRARLRLPMAPRRRSVRGHARRLRRARRRPARRRDRAYPTREAGPRPARPTHYARGVERSWFATVFPPLSSFLVVLAVLSTALPYVCCAQSH